MGPKKGVKLCILLLFLFAELLIAQIHFTAQIITPDIKSFFISDLMNGSSSNEIFRIELLNNSNDNLPCEISINIQQGINREPIGDGSTTTFALLPMGATHPPGYKEVASPTIITNRDLFSNIENTLSLDGGFNITNFGIDLQNQILSTGRLPADLYVITLKLTTSDGITVTPMDEYELILDLRVTGTTSVSLISPGSENYNPVDEIDFIYPHFQWDSGLSKFKLIISEHIETLPGTTELDPEDILNTRVVFEALLQKTEVAPASLDPAAIPIETNSYQYTDGRLQFGRTYFYQIIGLQGSSSGDGEEEIPSEIWAFKINDNTSGLFSSSSINILLKTLGIYPGLDNALAGPFEKDGELWGFSHENIYINGSISTISDLASYMLELKQSETRSFNIVIEDVP